MQTSYGDGTKFSQRPRNRSLFFSGPIFASATSQLPPQFCVEEKRSSPRSAAKAPVAVTEPMRTPVRSIEAVLLGEPRLERGGLVPPGRTRALFCFGWRFPTTLLSDCGDELFFSTPDCDGRWLVAEAKLVKKKGEEKKTLWICGCAGH